MKWPSKGNTSYPCPISSGILTRGIAPMIHEEKHSIIRYLPAHTNPSMVNKMHQLQKHLSGKSLINVLTIKLKVKEFHGVSI